MTVTRKPNIVLGGAVVGANVAVHLGEEAQHPELLKTPPHRANKAAGAYNALDTTLAELSEQRVQLTNLVDTVSPQNGKHVCHSKPTTLTSVDVNSEE